MGFYILLFFVVFFYFIVFKYNIYEDIDQDIYDIIKFNLDLIHILNMIINIII